MAQPPGNDTFAIPYFAKRGYACIRVDMRGNGDSDGLMDDEYSEQEMLDALSTINWLAAQKWCDSLMIAEFGVSRAFEYMLRISLLIALSFLVVGCSDSYCAN